MLHEMIQARELGTAMRDYAGVIRLIKEQKLNSNWVRDFLPEQLVESCKRIAAVFPQTEVQKTNIQRELIQNPAFPQFFSRLIALYRKKTEEKTADGTEQSTNMTPPLTLPRSLAESLADLLEVCWEHKRDLTAYSVDQVEAMLERGLDSYAQLVFLENFASADLSIENFQTAMGSLNVCVEPPLVLSEEQKWLLCDPVAANRSLFANAKFTEIWELLEPCPDLLDILQLLCENEVVESLSLQDYTVFAQNASRYTRHLVSVVNQLGADAASEFIFFWRKSECSLYELQRMDRRITENPEQDWNVVFSNYTGYVNLLYGNRFKELDLFDVPPFQADLLIYAITHRKKHFIRLVDENGPLFRSLSSHSILFSKTLYENHLNLNEFTERDLKDCAWMRAKSLCEENLQPGRVYTFPEIKALYDLEEIYVEFYNRLPSKSQDDRLKIFRQVVNNDALQGDMSGSDLDVLADRFGKKLPFDWLQKDFGHIAGLTLRDVTWMLIHCGQIEHLLPSMQCRTDVLLVMQNLRETSQFESMTEVRENLLQVDTNWIWLAEKMDLSEDFKEHHREAILAFLSNNGAQIARTYRERLDDKQRSAFQRVVKSELMGQFDKLKYFEGDLQKELSYPISAQMEAVWKKNLTIKENGLTVQEHDDFFSTILLGVQPYHTCLAYDNGNYSHCLLSSFDSNKKVLYAKFNGKIVGRAFLRLTKGSMAKQAVKQDTFTFADLDRPPEPSQASQQEAEHVTVFLERPYISGVGPEVDGHIRESFISLAVQKARELDTMLVLSTDYCEAAPAGFAQTKYYIYISKSKAGAQYLDSLNGRATVSDEGNYQASHFLLKDYTSGHDSEESASVGGGT